MDGMPLKRFLFNVRRGRPSPLFGDSWLRLKYIPAISRKPHKKSDAFLTGLLPCKVT